MKFAQLKDGYRYNSDTLVLYDFITSFGINGNVLDVGCGCGILGLLLKRDFPKISLTGIDFQNINTQISAYNAKQNGIDASFLTLDFKDFKSDKRFENIVLNPPFYHEGVKESENEHINFSRYAKHLSLETFLKVANSHLMPNGKLYFCYESSMLDRIFINLYSLKLKATALKFVHSILNEPSKLVLIKAQKNSRTKCKILPPLFMHEDGEYSAQANKIFKKSNTQSNDYNAKS